MPWRDVWLTLQGCYKEESALRRAAFIIRWSMVGKDKASPQKMWPLPWDGASDEEQTLETFKQFREQWRQLRN